MSRRIVIRRRKPGSTGLEAVKQHLGRISFHAVRRLRPRGGASSEAELIQGSGLFDENWYKERYPVSSGTNPVEHYCSVGAAAGYAPHPLFDVAWYCKLHSDVGTSDLTPLGHFIVLGDRLTGSPNPLFDARWYRRQRGVPLLISTSPFQHFLRTGGVGRISPHPLFNSHWYLARDPMLAAQGVNPLTHFVECGARQGRWPNPFFDVSWYLATYPEVHHSRQNPLAHFILDGARAGNQPHPDIDLDLYIGRTPQAPRDRLGAFVHLVQSDLEGLVRSPDPIGRVTRQAVPAPMSEEPPSGLRREALLPECRVAIDLGGSAASERRDDLPPAIDAPCDSERDELMAQLKGASVVSFDVWDTLLRRDCHPDETKLQSARALLLTAGEGLRPAYQDLRALFNARIQAENASATGEDFEFRFEDALYTWLRSVLLPGTVPGEIERLHRLLLEHEHRAEIRSTRPDLVAASLLRDQRRPCIFVSDFYLSQLAIARILDTHGVSRNIVKGYVSSDSYATKRQGDLYDTVLRDLALEPSELVHLGDHATADITVPSAKGVRAVAFTRDCEERRKAWLESAFRGWQQGRLEPHWRRLSAICEEVAKSFNSELAHAQLRAIGSRLAPIAVGFGLATIEEALRRGYDRAYFFSREGITFRRIYDALAACDPYNLDGYPESRVLMVSRRAAFAASLRELAPGELLRMWSLYQSQSPRALARSLNLDEDIVERAAGRAGLDPDGIVESPWIDRRFLLMLDDAELRRHGRQQIGRQREQLCAYLDQEGFRRQDREFVVDIGWRGSIQDSLALVCERARIHGFYLGLFSFLNAPPDNVTKKGWLFDESRGHELAVSEVAVLEMIFNAPGGSVTGYGLHGGAMTPSLEVLEGEEAIIGREVASLQEGMLAAVAPLADYVRLHGLTSAEITPLARRLTHALIARPPAPVADAFFKLHHNEMFGTGGVDMLGGRFDPDGLTSGTQGSDLHAAISRGLSTTRWRDGALRQSRVSKWWDRTGPGHRRCVPTEMFIAQAPALAKAIGSRVNIYAPPPLVGSGGHRTIFNLARRLQAIGMSLHVHLEGIGDGVEVVEEYLSGSPAVIHTSWRDARPADVALATVAHSAAFVARTANAHLKSYLVQDYEALFNPMSDGYLAAENSYLHGLQHLTIGNWLTHMLSIDYGVAASPAGFGVDTETYSREGSADLREPSVCFLYQPEKPRRAPALGIEALGLVKRAMPDVRICVYGSDLPIALDFEVENLRLVRDLAQLADLYGRCAVGLCISGSNPSRIPYEMMASGCVPVDLYRYNNLLDHEPGTILLAHQDAASIADAILHLLRNPSLTGRMSAAGRRFTATRSLRWEVDVLCNTLLAELAGTAAGASPVSLSYTHLPWIATVSRTPAVLHFCAAQRLRAGRGLPAEREPQVAEHDHAAE